MKYQLTRKHQVTVFIVTSLKRIIGFFLDRVFAFSIQLELIGRGEVYLWCLSILIYLFRRRRFENRCSMNRALGTRESPRFAEICLPFLGCYCFHCFALRTGLRNFEFPCRTKARGRRNLITKSKYFTRVVTVCRNSPVA